MNRNWRRAFLVVAANTALTACLPETGTPANQPPTNPSQTNSAPVITGSPATQAVVGSAYQFQPSASDPDGDSLTFTAMGLPPWAALNAQTGLISGTPGAGHAGTSATITVRVSDGVANDSLPAFSVSVVVENSTPPPQATGTAFLSWTPPTQNTDGTPLSLSDLTGYRVYHGTNPGSLSAYHDVEGANITTYEATRLATGTHYFAVTAVTTGRLESEMSAVNSKTIM